MHDRPHYWLSYLEFFLILVFISLPDIFPQHLQVDNIPLSQLTQPEAISRIKDNPRVILTVIRSSSATKAFEKSRPSLNDHVYEDILNSEDSSPIDKENTVLLQQESFRDRLGGCSREEMMRRKQRKQSDSQPMRINTSPGGSRHVSSSFLGDSGRGNVKPLTEKVSKDSGLSVGSSVSPSSHQHSGRHSRPGGDQVIRRPEPHLNMVSKHSYRSEREAMKRGSRDEDSCGSTDLPTMDPTKGQIYIDGDYEIEVRDTTVQKQTADITSLITCQCPYKSKQ